MTSSYTPAIGCAVDTTFALQLTEIPSSKATDLWDNTITRRPILQNVLDRRVINQAALQANVWFIKLKNYLPYLFLIGTKIKTSTRHFLSHFSEIYL